MSDIAPEQAKNGRVFWCWVKKYGLLVALLGASGTAGATIRNCVTTTAGVVGLQTVEASETHAEGNVKSFNTIWKAMRALESEVKKTTDNTEIIIKGMPDSWKRRARNNP